MVTQKKKKISKTKRLWSKVQGDPELNRRISLGPVNSLSLLKDPKHLGFTLSRYKFAAKMLHDRKKIVDIGCGEGVGCLVLGAETKAEIIGVDFDPEQITYAESWITPHSRAEFVCRDLTCNKLNIKGIDGLVSIDAIEHVYQDEQDRFFENILSCLTKDAVAVFGTPSLYSYQYTAERSRKGHVNLFDEKRLRDTLLKYFKNVFVFSMNDEMIHTGFPKMAHYFIALCCGKT
jgi:2-polyprenyl-3-methyl-5-hydroxy-6-metoxy-1,4-benzoquinol methylase